MLSLLGRRNLVGTGSPSNFLGADHASTKVPIEETRNERTSTSKPRTYSDRPIQVAGTLKNAPVAVNRC